MNKIYNKLVRDRIPEIISSEGRTCAVKQMDEMEYREALFAKLLEEAQEVVDASPSKLILEISDLYEVLDAILTAHGLSETQVRNLQVERRSERGGFQKRLKLLWVE